MPVNTDMLRQHVDVGEACVLKMYLDSKGVWTIGWGHNLRDVPISQRAADMIREDDIANAVADLLRVYPWVATELDDVRATAFAELSFNMGIARLQEFAPTIRHIRAHEWEDVATHLRNTQWYRDVKATRAERIIKMFLTGVDQL